jgi:MFS family permease
VTLYGGDPGDWDDDEQGHLAPVYRAPVVRHSGGDPLSGASLGVAVSATGLLFGLLADAPASWHWVFLAITLLSAIGLLFAGTAWYRAVVAPLRNHPIHPPTRTREDRP